jgi:hypothetical protein
MLLSNRWLEFYGPDGISPIKLREQIDFYRPSLFSYIHTEGGLWVFYALIVIMTVAMILGRWGKIPAIFLWLTSISIENSNSNNVNAEEFALCVFTFYAMVMPINATLVFNFRNWRFLDVEKEVEAWSLIPFLIHIDLIYIISLPLKPYFDHSWVDGTLVYLAANTFDMSRFPGLEILGVQHAIISKLMTCSSLLVEAAFPVLVWTKRFRVPVILAMVGFQIGIAVLLSGVQVFSLSMLLGLIMFLPSKTTHDFFMDPAGSVREYFGELKKALRPSSRNLFT